MHRVEERRAQLRERAGRGLALLLMMAVRHLGRRSRRDWIEITLYQAGPDGSR
jgi:hypothetical protein